MARPPQNMYAVLRYKNAHAVICEAFGFERNAVYEGPDGTVEHSQLAYRGGEW